VVSITVPGQRIDEQRLPALVDDVRTAAAQLTERISHLPHRGAWAPKSSDRKAA
jgi:hypothetical protein